MKPPAGSARRCSPFSHSSFSGSNTPGLGDPLERESLDQLGAGHEVRVVVEAPADEREVVHERVGDDAGVAELLDRDGPVALRELALVRPEHHGQVGENRLGGVERAIEGELAWVEDSRSSPRITYVTSIAMSSNGFANW